MIVQVESECNGPVKRLMVDLNDMEIFHEFALELVLTLQEPPIRHLLVPQGFNRLQAGCPVGRIDAEEQADRS